MKPQHKFGKIVLVRYRLYMDVNRDIQLLGNSSRTSLFRVIRTVHMKNVKAHFLWK